MKTANALVVASLLLASNAFGQSSPQNVPPPPGINDPGVKAVEAPARTAAMPRQAAPAAPARPLDLKPQALPSMQDNVAPAPRDNTPPDVSVRQEGENTIEEYRRSGQVYMVVITPRNGVPQTYMVDPQGRVVDEHGQKPVGPVMYQVLEWGKSKPASESGDDAGSAAPAQDGGGQ